MATQENNDERIALLQGTLDLLILKTLLHGESERIDSTENIESCLRHFRDDRAANFYASSPLSPAPESRISPIARVSRRHSPLFSTSPSRPLAVNE